ncbi:MAG: RagB/SusD family nutrient uptake outer membrane protein, partial [Chitinophagaceae bacterium]
MTKQTSIITFALLIAVISFTGLSCKKYLYEGPITSTYGDAFWVSQKAVEQASLAMYGQLRSSLRAAPSNNLGEASYFVNGDLPTGLFTLGNGDTFLKYSITAAGGFKFTYIPYGADVLQNWSRFYKLIAQSNLILQNVPVMPSALFSSDAIKNAYMGEALFMRAYTYFYITRIWGDPVYVSQSYNDVDYGNIPPLARSPEKMVLDSCIRDLRVAAGYLSYAGGNPSGSIRANKGTVYALMAHIFQWQHNYDSTHFYSQKVINEGGYALETMQNYRNIWAGKASSENIFELNMQYNANDPNFAQQNDWAEARFSPLAAFVKGDLVDNRKASCWIAPLGGLFDQTLFDTTRDSRYKSVFRRVAATAGDPAGYM